MGVIRPPQWFAATRRTGSRPGNFATRSRPGDARPFRWAFLFVYGLAALAQAGDVTLKNGTVIPGRAVALPDFKGAGESRSDGGTPYLPMIMIANDLQRYFVPQRQVAEISREVELSRQEVFSLAQGGKGRGKAIGAVGTILEASPWDAFGRRTVRLQTQHGAEDVIQMITKITPQYVKIVARDHVWETGQATSSLPPDVLVSILKKAINPQDPDQRLSVTRFLLQAGLYNQAQRELMEMRDRFPDLADTMDEVSLALAQLQAQQVVDELHLRQTAGQHQRVYQLAHAAIRQFAEAHINAGTIRSFREIVDQYDSQREQIAWAVAWMGDLQAEVRSSELVADVAPLRSEIAERLNVENLDRLDAFLKLAEDTKLPAEDRLALALSGWVVGSVNAVTDLPLAINLWRARFIVLEILRTAPDDVTARQNLYERLESIEGLSAARVAQLIPLLPPVIESDHVPPGVATRFELAAASRPKPPEVRTDGKLDAKSDTSAADRGPASYKVVLPEDYHPDHAYPLVIALHAQGRDPEHELEFWAGTPSKPGQSQRLGYIVAAPEYAATGQRSHDYSAASHHAVLDCLNDVRRRFHVDSNRVYLAGHGMGGDAVFDIGFSHPDLFAGIIPICGVSERYCEVYWQNGKDLPLYVVCGELDRDSVQRNHRELLLMMRAGYNLIYTDFIGAGGDSFYSEIHKLFAWMARHRRDPFPKHIDMRTLRATDNRFFWMHFEGLPEAVTSVDWSPDNRKRPRPMTVSGKVTPGNTLYLASGARTHQVWIAPPIVEFDKRLLVKIGGRIRWNEFVRPDLRAMLEDFRKRGDREQIYWAVLEF